MIVPIVAYGTPILRQNCVEMDNTDENWGHIVNLSETAINISSAVGLAAPQINVPLRAFLSPINDKYAVIINPVIRKRRGEQESDEGCLSIPGIFRKILTRSDIIDVEYYDGHFRKQRRKLRGFESIVFQHEYDHINGILFIDHLSKEGQQEIQEKLSLIEKGQTQTHYDMIFSNGDVVKGKKEAEKV